MVEQPTRSGNDGVRRGELWWADIPGGPHPVVLVSRDGSYMQRRKATVALVTSRIRGIPVEFRHWSTLRAYFIEQCFGTG